MACLTALRHLRIALSGLYQLVVLVNSHGLLQSRRPNALAGKPNRWMSEVLLMHPNSAKDQLLAGSRSFQAEDRQVAYPSATTRSASSSRTISSWRACQSASESNGKCHPRFL
ncbi:hypothetical protein ASPACDRAFT_80538, partial [Aspergillus aculeatus ATCC 16872]